MGALKTILIIEDDDSLRESLEMFLEERGYSVYSAATGVLPKGDPALLNKVAWRPHGRLLR